MFLTCPDEVIRFIGGTLRSALGQPAVADILADHPVAFRFGVVDPDCVLYVDSLRQEVRFSTSHDAPTAMIAMKADTAVAICQGRTDVASALARGEVVTAGDLDGLRELLEAADALPRLYADVAEREGRIDLLAS